MAKSLDERVKALEAKANRLQNIAWVMSTLAVVFGISGVTIWDGIQKARSEAAAAKLEATTARTEAAAAVNQLRTKGKEVLESFRPEFRVWVDQAREQMDRWPIGSYAVLRGKGSPCPAGFTQVDSYLNAIASFYDPAQNPKSYIKPGEFGASSLTCHGGADKCSQFVRDSPTNVQWLGDLNLSVCVK